MRLQLASRWPLHLLSISVVILLPAISWVYYPLLGSSGTLSPDADSVGIPMFESLFAAVLLTLPVGFLHLLASSRFKPGTRLSVWRTDRPEWSAAITVFFGVPAVLLLIGMVDELLQRLPAYEYLWSIYSLVILGWLLVVRAVLVNGLR